MDFFRNKRIFAEDVRDLFGVKCPSMLLIVSTFVFAGFQKGRSTENLPFGWEGMSD